MLVEELRRYRLPNGSGAGDALKHRRVKPLFAERPDDIDIARIPQHSPLRSSLSLALPCLRFRCGTRWSQKPWMSAALRRVLVEARPIIARHQRVVDRSWRRRESPLPMSRWMPNDRIGRPVRRRRVRMMSTSGRLAVRQDFFHSGCASSPSGVCALRISAAHRRAVSLAFVGNLRESKPRCHARCHIRPFRTLRLKSPYGLSPAVSLVSDEGFEPPTSAV